MKLLFRENRLHEIDSDSPILTWASIFVSIADESVPQIDMDLDTFIWLEETCIRFEGHQTQILEALDQIPKPVNYEQFMSIISTNEVLLAFYQCFEPMSSNELARIMLSCVFLGIDPMIEIISLALSFQVVNNLDESQFTKAEIMQTIKDNKWMHGYVPIRNNNT